MAMTKKKNILKNLNIMRPIIHKIFLIRKELMGKWNYYLWDQKVQFTPLLKKYYNHSGNGNQSKKCVIFMANGFVLHGGLADRIKGMLSVFSWCKSRNVEFKIHFVSPFQLNKYLLPNEYNWTIDEKEVFYDNSTKVSYLMLDSVSDSMEKNYFEKKTIQWMDEQWLDYKGQIHVYTNTDCCIGQYSKLFHTLFNPSKELSYIISQTKNIIGDEYITVSFRFTTLLGDFHDCINQELSAEEQNTLIEQCLCAITQTSRKHPAHWKTIVVSDSEKFLCKAKELPNVQIFSGKVGHIEYDSSSATHLKAFLDFFIISNATKVYLIKSCQMYNSAFPRMAALIGNKPFELVEI